jgi:hypothetical protein
MKKFPMTLFFILAVPILFSGPKSVPLYGTARVYACDLSQPGNNPCAGIVERKPGHKQTGEPKNPSSGDLPIGVESGVGMIALMLLLWFRMR